LTRDKGEVPYSLRWTQVVDTIIDSYRQELSVFEEAAMSIKPFFKDIGVAGVADIIIVAIATYLILIALKRTHRSGLIFAGIISVGAVYLAARKLNLVLTETLLQGFFAVILVAFIVIFQEDLRYFFERVGQWWVERRLPFYKRKRTRLPRSEVQTLVHTVADLAQEKFGALIVVRGRDTIARHIDGGEKVEGLLSEALLKSIFDPHSDGHDGAVIIDGDRIDRLGCYLPLSKNLKKLPTTGTRHAAALGLSELSDAFCLIVSEERGSISIARNGNFHHVPSPADLINVLEKFYDEITPPQKSRQWVDIFRKNYREKIAAIVLAVVLWTFVVEQSQVIFREFEVPVNYALVPGGLQVSTVQPARVKVTFAAKRREFSSFGEQDVKLVLNLWDAKRGRLVCPINAGSLSFPNAFELEDVNPRHVVLEIREKKIQAAADTLR
jgi:diadenylate cyclase